MEINRKNNYIKWVLILIIVTACSTRNCFFEFQHLPDEGWKKDRVIQFYPSLDSASSYTIDIAVRHNSDYEFANLWLFIEYIVSDSTVVIDTLNIPIAHFDGSWLGSGWGGNYQCDFTYKPMLSFDGKVPSFKISHAMRPNVIKGVTDIGLRVQGN